MANDDNEVWHLPKPLQISNPKVAEAAAEMAKDLATRVNSPFANRSPLEFSRIRAQERIRHLTSALRQVEQEIQTNRGREYGRKLEEARVGLMARLAENYAIVGNFRAAAEIAPDQRYKDEYAAKARVQVEGKEDLY